MLLHGYTDDGSCWTPIARRLEADYDVVMPDARAHGASSAPEAGYDYETMAGDVLTLLRALELSPARVLGHSMGAAVAAVAAGLEPARFSKLVLEKLPWWEKLGECTCPILLVVGDNERGALMAPEDVREVERRWRKGSTVRLSAGHSIHRDQCDAYLAAVVPFLAGSVL